MSMRDMEPQRQRILPNGCAHLVVSLSRNYLTDCSDDGVERRTAPGLMAGQRSVYEMVSSADLVDLAGAHFVPGAVASWLGDRADLISNRSLSLDEVWPGYTDRLRSRMWEGRSAEDRLQILEQCLAELLKAAGSRRELRPHPAVAFALEQLGRAPRMSIAEMARRSGWSERRFSQIFREQIGFPPKVWLRLQRLQRVVAKVEAATEVPWADIAVECGFYDQAHLANEFRSFSGTDLTTYTSMTRAL
jgi:AraC-like DNA-binding protein